MEIPKSVRRLNGFDDCTALSDLTIHDGIEKFLGFLGCSISYISLPETIRVIGSTAFRRWGKAIVDFSRCKNLEQIERYSFEKSGIEELDLSCCTKLKDMTGVFYKFYPKIIKIGSVTPPTLESNYSSTAILYVPAESIDAYKAADGWKEFKDIRAL